uniref:RxLR effector candidate protein n=1 Tax=Hyaloperonospora arabidopsidis (strain Emoy2) TaxID=559515 RepID=M4B160_HYAAE
MRLLWLQLLLLLLLFLLVLVDHGHLGRIGAGKGTGEAHGDLGQPRYVLGSKARRGDLVVSMRSVRSRAGREAPTSTPSTGTTWSTHETRGSCHRSCRRGIAASLTEVRHVDPRREASGKARRKARARGQARTEDTGRQARFERPASNGPAKVPQIFHPERPGTETHGLGKTGIVVLLLLVVVVLLLLVVAGVRVEMVPRCGMDPHAVTARDVGQTELLTCRVEAHGHSQHVTRCWQKRLCNDGRSCVRRGKARQERAAGEAA